MKQDRSRLIKSGSMFTYGRMNFITLDQSEIDGCPVYLQHYSNSLSFDLAIETESKYYYTNFCDGMVMAPTTLYGDHWVNK